VGNSFPIQLKPLSQTCDVHTPIFRWPLLVTSALKLAKACSGSGGARRLPRQAAAGFSGGSAKPLNRLAGTADWHKACSHEASSPGAEKATGPKLSEFENRMSAFIDKQKTEALETAERVIQDRGGARSGRDRRQANVSRKAAERRSGKDRRCGIDRRSGVERRKSGDRRPAMTNLDWEFIERRDACRHRLKGK
jgi:hypothetical protein